MSTVNDMLRPEPKRDRYGRYLIVPADGDASKAKAHTRVTTLAKALDDTYYLELWAARMIALGLAARPDLLAGVSACSPDDKKELNKLVDKAKEAAGAGARATIGTALHRVTERVDAGEQFEMPEMFRADVTAYREMIVKAGIEILPDYIEKIVVIPEFSVAGTFDRIVRHEGKLKIADVKTGEKLDLSWLSIAIQESLYANAETIYDPITERHELMPEVDKTEGLVFHVPAGEGRATLHRVDLTAGWDAAHLCQQVRITRSRKGVSTPVMLDGFVDATSVEPAGAPAAEPESVEPAPSFPTVFIKDEPPTPTAAPTIEGGFDASANPFPVARTVPTDTDVPVEVVRAWVIERLQAIIAAGHSTDVAKRWPEGVATLKASQDHTMAQLDEISKVLWTVETLHQMTFPEPDPRIVAADAVSRAQWVESHVPHVEQDPEQLVRDAFPGSVDVSDGDSVASREDCDFVIFALQQLDEASLAKVQEVCRQGGVPNLRSGKATTAHLELVLRTMDETDGEEEPF